MGAKPSVQGDENDRPHDEGRDPQDVGHHIVQQEQQEEGDRVVGARQHPPDFLRRATCHHGFSRTAVHGAGNREDAATTSFILFLEKIFAARNWSSLEAKCPSY